MSAPKPENKSAVIRHLIKDGMPRAKVAEIANCSQAYVRAVIQRMDGPSVAEKNYGPKQLEKRRKRYAEDPDYRAHCLRLIKESKARVAAGVHRVYRNRSHGH